MLLGCQNWQITSKTTLEEGEEKEGVGSSETQHWSGHIRVVRTTQQKKTAKLM